jgi:hypothetical protein
MLGPTLFLKQKPRVARGSVFYLRSPEPGPVGVNVDPLGERLGMSVFPEAFLPLLGAVEPVVPVTLPVGFTDEPVVAPLVPVVGTPVLCASANVLESAKVVASAIVVSFMCFPSCRFDNRQPHRQFYRSLNSSLSVRSRKAFHMSQSLDAPAIFLIDAARNDLQRIVRQRPLQRLGFVPWRAHPRVPFFRSRVNLEKLGFSVDAGCPFRPPALLKSGLLAAPSCDA